MGCAVGPLVGSGDHNNKAPNIGGRHASLVPFRPFPRLKLLDRIDTYDQPQRLYAIETHRRITLPSDRISGSHLAQWFQSHRAPPSSRSRTVPSHHYQSSAFDDRISQRQTHAWEQCHQYWVRLFQFLVHAKDIEGAGDGCSWTFRHNGCATNGGRVQDDVERMRGLTSYAQVAGLLQGIVFKAAHSLSKNCGCAWTRQ